MGEGRNFGSLTDIELSGQGDPKKIEQNVDTCSSLAVGLWLCGHLRYYPVLLCMFELFYNLNVLKTLRG